MNRTMLVAMSVALLSSGCVARVSGPRVVVAEPPPPVVVAPPPVVVAPTPVVLIEPPVLIEAPRLVIVPGTQVYTVPTATFNVFVFGGHYYSYHQGAWYHTARHGEPWRPVAVAAVPVQVRNVPVQHWKIPPGQEKKGERAERERHCPPGLAKKGEC